MADRVLGGPSVSPLTAADLDTITIRISKGARMEPELDASGNPTNVMVRATEQGEPGPRPNAGEPWMIGANYTVRTSEGKKTSGISPQFDHPASVSAALKTIRDYVLGIAQGKVAGANALKDV